MDDVRGIAGQLQVQSRTYADAAVERIHERIAASEFAADGRLPSERRLCEELGVSRTVVREALASLEALGVVESRSTRGWFVAPGDAPGRSEMLVSAWLSQHADQYADIDEIRSVLEAYCVRSLTSSNAYDVARRARALLVDQSAAIERSDALQAAAADREFHQLLCSKIPNRALQTLMPGLIDSTRREVLAVYALPETAGRSLEQHVAIVDALTAGDREHAAVLVAEHMTDVIRRYRAAAANGDAG